MDPELKKYTYKYKCYDKYNILYGRFDMNLNQDVNDMSANDKAKKYIMEKINAYGCKVFIKKKTLTKDKQLGCINHVSYSSISISTLYK